jgi:hypothetical protein
MKLAADLQEGLVLDEATLMVICAAVKILTQNKKVMRLSRDSALNVERLFLLFCVSIFFMAQVSVCG